MTAHRAEDKQVFARRRTALRTLRAPEGGARDPVAGATGRRLITGAVIPVDSGLMARNAWTGRPRRLRRGRCSHAPSTHSATSRSASSTPAT